MGGVVLVSGDVAADDEALGDKRSFTVSSRTHGHFQNKQEARYVKFLAIVMSLSIRASFQHRRFVIRWLQCIRSHQGSNRAKIVTKYALLAVCGEGF